MKNVFSFSLLLLVITIIACSDNKISENDKVKFAMVDTTYIYGDCESKEIGCVTFNLSYLVLNDAKYKILSDSVNESIKPFLFENPCTDYSPLTFQTLIDCLTNDYKISKEEIPDLTFQYSYDREIFVSTDTLGIFAISFIGSDYFGGAHPNSFFGFSNFKKENGTSIDLDDILVPNYQQKLNAVAEKIFRLQYELTSDQNLEEAGYWFENNKFALNNNFLITNTGLKFLYNPYEIASYAQGVIEFEINYPEIEDLIKKDGLLKDFIF